MTTTDFASLDVHAGAVSPVISYKPIAIAAPEHGGELQVRVSAPAHGQRLAVVVFSHGFGWSMDAYAPLVDHWAAHGLVVVQPTHLDSRRLGLAPTDARYPSIWRVRVDDLVRILDSLDQIQNSVPGLASRVDSERIAVAGHSWGAQTAGTLLGARVLDARTGTVGEDLSDPRVRAGVLLSITGTGETLAPFAAENFPFMRPSFETLSVPSLVMAGDQDDSPLSSRGPDWFTDAYRLSPGARHLVTLLGAEHSLGGIVGEGAAETTDESPERVAAVQALSTAFLQTALGVDDAAWNRARAALDARTDAVARVDSK